MTPISRSPWRRTGLGSMAYPPHHQHCPSLARSLTGAQPGASPSGLRASVGRRVADFSELTACWSAALRPVLGLCGDAKAVAECRCDQCGAELCDKCSGEHGDHLLGYRPNDD